MESTRHTKIAVLQNVQKGTEFCTKYGVLSSKHFKDCREMELDNKTIVQNHFVNFSFIVSTKVIFILIKPFLH
jgi:hypothetical protein